MDNNALFSETIENIPCQATPWIRNVLNFEPDDWGRDDPEFQQFLKDLDVKEEEVDDLEASWPGFSWVLEEIEGVGAQLKLRSEENYDEDCLIIFIQALFRRYMPDAIFKMTCALTCSGPRYGEFGGAWLVVSSDQVKSGSTIEAANKAFEEMKQKPYRINISIDIDAVSAEEAYKKLYETMYEVDREEFSWESTDEWYDPNGNAIPVSQIEDIRMRVIGQKDEESGC